MTSTPPPLEPTSVVPTHPKRTAPHVIAITAAALGAVIVLGTAGAAAASTLVSSSTSTSTRVVDVKGVDNLRVDAAAAHMEVRFGDVTEAQLDVTGVGGADQWTFERKDDELVVTSPRGLFGLGWMFGGDSRAVLTLPQNVKAFALDADITLAAGELTVDGSFAELDVKLGAGRMIVSGEAKELSADVSAGRADFELQGVQEADLRVSAGDLVGRITGAAPQRITVDVSAGSARLTLPDEDYDVKVEVSAGGMDNRLSTSTSAPRTITGDVSAGNLVLRPAE